MQEEKVTKKEFNTKNVVTVWNNLTLWKKIGCAVLLACLWMLYLDEWLGIGDILDVLL